MQADAQHDNSAPQQPHSAEMGELEMLRQQLQQAQKMTALGELVSTTTHEFNNVLMTIINYAKMGLRHQDAATRDKCLNKILSAGQRAAKITGSVLGMARNRSDAYEPTDVVELLDSCLVLLERELHKYRISLERELADVPRARANGNQIQQVLLNLIINARQAMERGGNLVLKVQHDADQNMVDITVRDTGKGIPQEDLPKIFEAFYSTKSGPDASGKGGTGLGLAACRDIIHAHRGRIRVESTVGQGTAVTIKLPVATETEQTVAVVPTLGVPPTPSPRLTG